MEQTLQRICAQSAGVPISDVIANFTFWESDIVIEENNVYIKFCTRFGIWGAVALIFVFLPWVAYALVLVFKFGEYYVEKWTRRQVRFSLVVRRALGLSVITFLANTTLSRYIQMIIQTPAQRPDCALLRASYGMPAQDPFLFFQVAVQFFILFLWFKVDFEAWHYIVLLVLPFLNVAGLLVTGLNLPLQILAGALGGIALGIGFAYAIALGVNRQDEKPPNFV
jgi:hypothetical protein